jgi:alanyl-tRNA synthetase
MKSSAEIRQTFLEFFRGKGHEVVASSPLVPGNDPTLLFTNSGMVQFKDVFLGADKRSYTRATSSQRCVRAGGKHNDLDSVGYTARHHTFFEMLGNFSFGDYFKRDAIRYAWELLTEVYGLPAERLWVTVYHTDDEAYDLWAREVGVPVERIVRIGDNKGAPFASDNFWQMADTGPCGPCTEIFYDHGPGIAGGPPGSPDEDGDRYIEIWNLVFMQFDRAPDGTLSPLPKPCVDTGMGLERLAAVLQHVHSNYEIDLFQNLIRAAAAATGTPDIAEKSLRVIADHIRASAFLIVDGVLPSNEGRGYVLRRIIRRALRHGWKLGTRGAFFHTLVPALVKEMGSAYPELVAKQSLVEAALRAEEERFAETLDTGMRVFEDVAAKSVGTVAGEDAFRLYDTYGFPVDLTADIARERGLAVDMAGFERAMDAQRERAAPISPPTWSSDWRQPRSSVTTRWLPMNSKSQRSSSTAMSARRWPTASRPSSCSSARRSMPSRVDRLVTPASCARPPAASRWPTRSSLPPSSTAMSVAGTAAACDVAIACAPWSTANAARPRC